MHVCHRLYAYLSTALNFEFIYEIVLPTSADWKRWFAVIGLSIGNICQKMRHWIDFHFFHLESLIRSETAARQVNRKRVISEFESLCLPKRKGFIIHKGLVMVGGAWLFSMQQNIERVNLFADRERRDLTVGALTSMGGPMYKTHDAIASSSRQTRTAPMGG